MGVDWVTLVRVDNHNEESRIGVDHLRLVAGLQVPEDRGIVEVGQVDHVLALLKLRRVDPVIVWLKTVLHEVHPSANIIPANLRGLEIEFLMATCNDNLLVGILEHDVT